MSTAVLSRTVSYGTVTKNLYRCFNDDGLMPTLPIRRSVAGKPTLQSPLLCTTYERDSAVVKSGE